jgi:hypothetical protein
VEAELPRLLSDCEHFDASVRAAAKKNANIQYISSHYSQIIELLEIPSLIDACISNDLLEEAVDMIQFAKTLFEERSRITQPSSSSSSSSPSSSKSLHLKKISTKNPILLHMVFLDPICFLTPSSIVFISVF